MTTATKKASSPSLEKINLDVIIPTPRPPWTICPVCSVEWTRLHPCGFRNPLGNRGFTSICINCALDARALLEVNAQICKLESVSIQVKRFSYSYEVPRDCLTKSMFYALVEIGGIKFHLSMTTSGQKLQIKHSMNESRPLFTDNNIAALFLMNNVAMNPLEFEKLNAETEIPGRTPAKKFW